MTNHFEEPIRLFDRKVAGWVEQFTLGEWTIVRDKVQFYLQSKKTQERIQLPKRITYPSLAKTLIRLEQANDKTDRN